MTLPTADDRPAPVVTTNGAARVPRPEPARPQVGHVGPDRVDLVRPCPGATVQALRAQDAAVGPETAHVVKAVAVDSVPQSGRPSVACHPSSATQLAVLVTPLTKVTLPGGTLGAVLTVTRTATGSPTAGAGAGTST